MSDKFDPANAKTYFSSSFLKNHIFVGSTAQKKKAETVFQRRGKAISTVICLTRSELVQLAGEIHSRQKEFKGSGKYLSLQKYDYWQRGGSKAKDKQRATSGNGRFHYAVRSERDGKFVMCHFESVS